jgi:hypothetical protein
MNFIHPNAQISNNHSEPMDSSVDVRSEDLFDLERLRLSQNFPETVGVKKRLITVPVRKPSGQDFIRVHPDPGMRLETTVLELKEEGKIYLVDPSLR